MPMGERFRRFAKHANEKTCVLRSLKVALFVGTVLAFINHYDAILSGSLSSVELVKVLVTYAVPYSVATFGSASQAMQMDSNSAQTGAISGVFSDARNRAGPAVLNGKVSEA